MRYKSNIDKNITCEEWKTPLKGADSLSLECVMQIGGDVYFFFYWRKSKYDKKREVFKTVKKKYVALRISYLCPYRLTEENISYGGVLKYLSGNNKKKDQPYCYVYKLWNTPYIQEMDKGEWLSKLSRTGVIKRSDLHQVMILTDDQTIEFISNWKPEWAEYNPQNFSKLLVQCYKYSEGKAKDPFLK